MLVRVLYSSQIAPGISAEDIERLVASARRRNRQLDLTGALLVCDGRFVQVLEGREVCVNEMVDTIAADRRHHDMLVLDRMATAKRLFATWDMAFIDEASCEPHVQALLDRVKTPEQFLQTMTQWIAEHRSAPL